MDKFEAFIKTSDAIGNIIGNFFFFIFGGFLISLSYFFAGLILSLTVIGIPFGLQCFKLGIAMMRPYGLDYESDMDKPLIKSAANVILNIIWLPFGILIALDHIFCGILLSLTIIGMGLGAQHFRFIGLALMPFGKKLYKDNY